jgi:starvation-inducible DNA-binding protein
MSIANVLDELNGLIADAAVFHYKLHHFHWNVKGEQFFALHDKFEELYGEWGTLMDDLAERIMALGGGTLPSLSACLTQTSLKEASGIQDDRQMVQSCIDDIHSQRSRMLKASAAAQEINDKTTENILDEFIDGSAKHVWMLNAFLGKATSEK